MIKVHIRWNPVYFCFSGFPFDDDSIFRAESEIE